MRQLPSGRPHPGHWHGGRRADLGREVTGQRGVVRGAPGAISCLAFSENGYYLATGAADATVKLWDLRKLKNFHTITPAAGGNIGGVQFDYSGQFLTVGSNDVR